MAHLPPRNVSVRLFLNLQACLSEMTFLGSLPSSPFIPKPNSIPHLSIYHNNNPNPNPRFLLPVPHHHHHRRTLITFKFSTNSDKKIIKDDESPPIVSEVKKSFAVATGELFLGLASRIIKRTQVINGGRSDTSEVPIKIFRERENLEQEEVVVEKVEEYLSGRGRVVVVEEDPGVIWEQPLKDLEAEMGRKKVSSPGFSFSAAGLLFPYHLGVAEFLIEKGYIKETTPLAGSSAGAIVCVVIASGSSMKEALEATKVLAKDCRLKGTAFRLGAVLRNVLEEFLPDDVHIRSNGRVRVAVTQIFWRPRGLLVDQFESKEDLIDAVFTSSFIPGYLAPRPATLFRNRLCIDGGLTLFMPPTSAAKTVRICAFPTDRLGFKGIGISPDCNPENRATPRQLLNWALEPAEDYILDRLFEFGYLDAAVWAEQNPVEETVEDYNRSTTADC